MLKKKAAGILIFLLAAFMPAASFADSESAVYSQAGSEIGAVSVMSEDSEKTQEAHKEEPEDKDGNSGSKEDTADADKNDKEDADDKSQDSDSSGAQPGGSEDANGNGAEPGDGNNDNEEDQKIDPITGLPITDGGDSQTPTVPTVAAALDSDNHIAYMSGDSKNLFRPAEKITRAETAKIIWSLIRNKDTLGLSDANQFSDVPDTAWYKESVNKLAALGVLNGYGGSFKPANSISRAEFVTMLARFFPSQYTEISFSDVPADFWAVGAIRTAAANGWISGYEDGTFRPSEGMTRTEAAVIINRALGRTGDESKIKEYIYDGIKFFPDVDSSYWGYINIMEACMNHQHAGTAGNETWTSFEKQGSSLSPGMHQINGKLYYVDAETGDFVCNKSVQGHYFGEKRYYTTGNDELDRRLFAVTSRYINDNMSQIEQLRALFNHVVNDYGYRAGSRLSVGQTGWEEQFALEMLRNGKGNCYRYAALYYYLAKEVGCEPRAVSGLVGRNMRPHGWVEITDPNGTVYIYDTELTMANHVNIFRKTYAGAPYIYTK
ncbi:MAG: hypothetical protein HFE90_05565 [Firmicutes bacterium]|nr:hypothetical protein [Bacillota bacterium]